MVLGVLLAAAVACGGRSNQGIEATVDAVNTAVELTLAAMTPSGPGTAAPTSAPAATSTPPPDPATAAPPPSDTVSAPTAAAPTAGATESGPARPNGTIISAPFRDSAPTIDAQQGDWPTEFPYSIDQIVFNPAAWLGAGDQVGRFNIMWDQNNLYLFVVVEDDVHVQNDTGQTLYRGDSLELQFDADLAGDFDATSLNGDDYQIGLSPGAGGASPENYFWNPLERRGQPTGISLATRRAEGAGGYILEAAIPWSLFGVTPNLGSRFGFALNSSDNDSPGTTEQQSMISTVITRRLQDPTTWGTLALGEQR